MAPLVQRGAQRAFSVRRDHSLFQRLAVSVALADQAVTANGGDLVCVRFAGSYSFVPEAEVVPFGL
jgi:hypothetical protein